MSLTRTVLAAAILCVLAIVVAAKKGPSPTAPTYVNYVANVTEVVVQSGQPDQGGNVLISWQMDETRNRTAYTGPNIQPLVADFTGLTIYYLDYYHICQYTCSLDFNTPCDDQINGVGLCSYDQINRSQYLDEEEIDGVQAYHYIWQDPLGVISMAQHELWVNAQTGYPTVMKADYHPFGTWEANVTVTYNSFTAGTPPAANFAFTNEQYCYPGTEEQCNDTVRRLGRYMRMSPKAPKKILTEQ